MVVIFYRLSVYIYIYVNIHMLIDHYISDVYDKQTYTENNVQRKQDVKF